MTLSILAKKKIKRFLRYFIGSIACLICNLIYSLFSHNVSSIYMTYCFIIPLISGIIIFFINYPSRLFLNLFNSGISTITVGLFIKGVFDIAGASSNYQVIYYIVGMLFIIISFIVQKYKKQTIDYNIFNN